MVWGCSLCLGSSGEEEGEGFGAAGLEAGVCEALVLIAVGFVFVRLFVLGIAQRALHGGNQLGEDVLGERGAADVGGLEQVGLAVEESGGVAKLEVGRTHAIQFRQNHAWGLMGTRLLT